ncbi:MAG TPA: type II CAAX endopeptidase family protein [Candidatus Angelobacter sp.]|nr:type II CAAX endopeptidase family protein [Candidatus Angelobacter sp.]
MKKRVWFFLVLAYAITWLVWITASSFGVAPGHGEYIAAFGTAGPALAAIFLSRRGPGEATERLPARLFSFAALWLFAWAIYTANDRLRGIHAPTSILYYSVVGLLAMIPAWILSGAFTRDAGVRNLLHSFVQPDNWRWQAISFFFWPAMLLIPAAIGHLFHRELVRPESHGVLWVSAAFGGVSFLNNFLFTAALEEPGWRGYLLPQLQGRFSPLLASLLVWLPWALWHAPLDFHRPFRFTFVNYLLIRVFFLIPITVILTWLYNRSGGNLLTVTIFHAAMNTFPFVLPYYAPAFGLVILFAGLVIVTDRMWRRSPTLA